MVNKRKPRSILLLSEFLLLLREKIFIEIKFSTNTSILVVKYNYLGLKYKNSFYLFKNQLNYVLGYYFAKLETTKGNINIFLFNLFIALLTKKLFYKNANKQIENLLEIF